MSPILSKSEYSQILTNFCQNCLLNLYLTITESKQYISEAKRNEILLIYTKKNKQNSKYSLLKKDFKSFIQIAKKSYSEQYFWEILNSISIINQRNSIVDEYLRFFCQLHEYIALDLSFDNNFSSFKEETIHVSTRSLYESINKDSSKELPIKATLFTERPYDEVISEINNLKVFKATLLKRFTGNTRHEIQFERF